MVTYQFLLSAWEEKEKFMEQSLFLFSPSLSLSFPRSDGEDVSALDRCLLPLVSKLNASCWARQTLIKINISIFSKSACERERGGEWERKKENTFTFFRGQSHLNEKKGKNERSSVIFLYLNRSPIGIKKTNLLQLSKESNPSIKIILPLQDVISITVFCPFFILLAFSHLSVWASFLFTLLRFFSFFFFHC